MGTVERGAGTPAPAPTTPSPRERIAQLKAARAAEAAERPSHVLTLETIDPEPRFVAVDGADHRIRFYDDLTLVEHARFARLQRRAAALAAEIPTGDDAGELDDDRAEALSAELDDLYGGMVRTILPTLPEDALGRLSFHQRQMVVQAFNAAQAERNARTAGRAAGPARPTGARSSTPSPRASAPTRTTGSRSRRSASSSAPTGR